MYPTVPSCKGNNATLIDIDSIPVPSIQIELPFELDLDLSSATSDCERLMMILEKAVEVMADSVADLQDMNERTKRDVRPRQ